MCDTHKIVHKVVEYIYELFMTAAAAAASNLNSFHCAMFVYIFLVCVRFLSLFRSLSLFVPLCTQILFIIAVHLHFCIFR